MIKKQIFTFFLRWIASSLGMYLCITWLGTISPEATGTFSERWMIFATAGLIFSVVNSIVKPLIKVFALPLAILTMGISTIIINTAMVILTIHLLPGVEMGIWGAAISSAIMSVIHAGLNLLIS